MVQQAHGSLMTAVLFSTLERSKAKMSMSNVKMSSIWLSIGGIK